MSACCMLCLWGPLVLGAHAVVCLPYCTDLVVPALLTATSAQQSASRHPCCLWRPCPTYMLGCLQERFAKNWVKLRAWEMTDFDSIVMLVCWLVPGHPAWVDLLMPCSLVLGLACQTNLHCSAQHGKSSLAQPLPGPQMETWRPQFQTSSAIAPDTLVAYAWHQVLPAGY